MDRQFDVVVVGAGPVGLLLAIELKLGGAEVLVLERLTAPNLAIKAPSVGPLGAEALQRQGMGRQLDEVEERTFAAMGKGGAAARARGSNFRGHFALFPIRTGPENEPDRRIRMVDQQGLEAILGEKAAALNIDIRRGSEVTTIDQHPGGVEVRWTSPTGPDATHCGWLVGCDGGRSTIRKLAGFAFPGTPPTMTMYQAVLDLDHPERLPAYVTRTSEGVLINGPRPRRIGLHDFSGPPLDRDAPVTREEVEGVLRRISGADVRVTAVEQVQRWTDTARLADTYQRDHVLLAGDAAHVHSPVGGQGLSLGLVDASNLGWKLTAVIRGDKPANFLDSYTFERRPVAEAVLANTLAQITIMRPAPHSNAMRNIFAKLLEFDDVNGYIDGLMSGLDTRYDLGSEDNLVGQLTGDRLVNDGAVQSSLFEKMDQGDGIILDATPEARLSDLAAGYNHVRCFPVEGGPSLLIRPDGCITWAGDESELEGLADSLNRWFAPVVSR